ncbi:Starch-binding associating with outer membrane [Pustulibacterium marinum]|uniref:Starch-binding associating with outer membrane n=1 Tax=Pustulibacterium marinum TaxID=1224947 RepID=A0A1I7F2B5_9FLAO|nr:RagB/SusD family nutrient uptake outer membrane protein [Pustulibacterium marinum]SFU30391.1 Starch-binding associating with outer membrane [Pustulibacterium marinum]
MKNIIKHKIVVGALVASAMFTSCGDDFVETDAPYGINSESYFSSQDDYYNALVGAYDVLQSTYVNVIMGEIASDNAHCGGESATDVIGWQQVDRMVQTPVNDNLKNVWDWNFAGVQRAAFILENKDKIEFEGKDQIIGEAYFLRAYFNFELVKWFGPIPIKPEGQFVSGDETSYPRATTAEVYAYIESDLVAAKGMVSATAPEVGRVTKGAVQALLGKAYLYQDKFAEAATELDDVINSGMYHLYGSVEGESYSNLFEYMAENSAESVFEVQYTGTEGAGFGCLQCSEGNVAVGFSGIRGYSGPTFEGGYGFNLPTEEAYNAFDADDMRKDVTVLDIEAWAAANPSVEYSIGNQDPETGHTGYYNRKYLPRINDNQGDANLTQPNNYRAIRFADVLLMAAEAYNRGGLSDATAQEYMNEVRRRAFGDENHDVIATGNTLTNLIWNERRLELMGEGHRFFDLVRTNQAAGTIDGFTAGKNEVFPIPLQEIQFSQGAWEQNPNY